MNIPAPRSRSSSFSSSHSSSSFSSSSSSHTSSSHSPRKDSSSQAYPRQFSPPLQLAPFFVKHPNARPISLCQLSTDSSFLTPLQDDIRHLLRQFSESWVSSRSESPSPFRLFSSIWSSRGWDYVHFALGDDNQSRCNFYQTLSRCFLAHLDPLLPTLSPSRTQRVHSHSLADHEQARTSDQATVILHAVASLFSIYILWETQLSQPERLSANGLWLGGKVWKKIQIELDYYEVLMDLPKLAEEVLDPKVRGREEPTPRGIPPVADVVHILRKLCGAEPPQGERSGGSAPTHGSNPNPARGRLRRPVNKRKRGGEGMGDHREEQDEAGQAGSTSRQRSDRDNDGVGRRMEDGRSETLATRPDSSGVRKRSRSPAWQVLPPTGYRTRQPRDLVASLMLRRSDIEREDGKVARLVGRRWRADDEAGAEELETIRTLTRSELILMRVRERLDLPLLEEEDPLYRRYQPSSLRIRTSVAGNDDFEEEEEEEEEEGGGDEDDDLDRRGEGEEERGKGSSKGKRREVEQEVEQEEEEDENEKKKRSRTERRRIRRTRKRNQREDRSVGFQQFSTPFKDTTSTRLEVALGELSYLRNLYEEKRAKLLSSVTEGG
ncbi:hypothetical protein IE53DRAFT_412210 [Violaceomyces palustris]|uniref:Uncharacterized protein n=1 Tax=Violaceomyces palustris TaxID=1673888 RepID=A0ACD0NRY7_9BASI|nr:hypothetical protein IE53DRAFT_412210 [Violaceomyces palustris]